MCPEFAGSIAIGVSEPAGCNVHISGLTEAW
jgi:hypothetical protein